MRHNAVVHGCLVLAASACLATTGSEDSPIRVRSRILEIEYQVNESALPLDSVQLWCTLDRGRTWHSYGFDDDRQSPFAFHASAEGLHGFFLRASNRTGASDAEPGPLTEAHLWVFIDYTPPVVQLQALRQTTVLGQRVVQIRWTAIDGHLTQRPVEIEYRRLSGGDHTWVALEPLANTGRYDWRVPEDLVGAVSVRLYVSDEGGHRVGSKAGLVELAPIEPPDSPSAAAEGFRRSASRSPPGDEASILTEPTKERARRLLEQGLTFGDQGDYRQGIARLREAVKLDPQMTEAFVGLGTMLYDLGDFDRALAAYEIALGQRPTMRAALQGVAKVFRQKSDYVSAAQSLRTILRYNPNDAETWMNLGDIGVFQGDEVLARECYLRATQIDPEAAEVIAQARIRLALMREVSRSYQRGE